MVDYVTLMTALCQIEDIVKNWPLTYIPSDELDFVALTPNHFLKLGGTNTNVNTFMEINLDRLLFNTLNPSQGYKHVCGLVSDFRKAFHHHYFTFLKGKAACNHRYPWGSLPFIPHCNDVVLVNEQMAIQGSWPFGVVTSVEH